MNIYPLGWQSWSPLADNLFHLPLWDYPPHLYSPTVRAQSTQPPKPPISLWCSWHSNGTKISEKLILNQAQIFQTHKFVPEYILIDDGWCLWGDWQTPTPAKFKHSLPPLALELKRFGYQTGLWLAPFLVDPRSNLVKDHPDWIIKNQSGSFFNGFMSYPLIRDLTPKYLLDFTNPKVMQYIFECLDLILSRWNITLLKLDHLYAPFFAPDPSVSGLAPEALTTLFSYIQKKYPHVYTIACGCPFDVAAGRVDAVRISKDINSPYFTTFGRHSLLRQKLTIASQLNLPFGIDPDAAINLSDAKRYYNLWQSGQIQVFGLGYNL